MPHPEWAPGCFAAGIPGEVRFIYQPRRGIYNWDGTVVKGLERDVPYHVFYFDPATGRRFDQGTVMYAGPTAPPFDPSTLAATGKVHRVVSDEFKAPNVPSPQDWVLVLERVKP